jgi:non-heme chloroperoxidase
MPLHELPDGAALAYDDVGTGPTLVLLPGALVTRRWFDSVVGELAEHVRVLAPDYRSHGDSPRAAGGHTVAGFARDVHHFLRAHAPDGAVLAGWSMGALVGWELLDQHPDDHGLTGFVSIGQSPSDRRQDDWPDGPLDLETVIAWARGIQEDPVTQYAAMFDEPWQRADVRRVDPTVASLVLIDQTMRDYRAVVARTAIPTLLVAGTRDPFLSPAQIAWVVEHAPDVRVCELDAGHMAFLEARDPFVAATLAFVRDVAGPAVPGVEPPP